MSVRRIQLRRGTTAENNAFTGAVGEITVNTSSNSIRVHDGETLGGSETARSDLSNILPITTVDFNAQKIINVADPEDAQDVATKAYVDANVSGGSLATLSDVDVAGVAPGEYLKYSGTEWINDSLSTEDLTDGADIAMIVGGTITANLDGNALTSSAWLSPMTLNLTGTVLTGSVSFDGSASVDLNASLNDNSIENAKLVNDSVSIGGSYDLALGGTLNLSNLAITGSTLSLATSINLVDDQVSALDINENGNSYLKFITTNGSEKVTFGKKFEAPTESKIADLEFQTGYIYVSSGDLAINTNGGNVTIDDSVAISGTLKLGHNTQEGESNNVGVRFDYYDSPLLDAEAIVNGTQYIIKDVGNTNFTLVGALFNQQNWIFTATDDGAVLLAGTTGKVYPNASLKTGFFGHDKSDHVFTMYNTYNNEATLGDAKFNNLTLTGDFFGNAQTASALVSPVTLSIGGSVITGSVAFDGSQSVEILADIVLESITGGMIANSTITNSKLEHDFIAFNNHEVHLGEEVTIEGTDGEISVSSNLGVITIGLAGTIVATSAIALAKTINLAGNLTGSVSLDNALASVTLTATLGTITNGQLQHSFIAINDFQIDLGNNLDVVGANGVSVTMDEPNSTMTIGLGTISVDNLSTKTIAFSDSDSSENIPLGGTITFLGVENETSVFVLGGEVNIGLAENVDIQGNLIVGGTLTVNGSITSINTVNLDVTDSIILLGSGTSANPTATNDAGFIIERGNTQPSASLFWDESESHFAVITADSIGSTTSNVVTQANNLAYADFKANSIIANLITGSTLSISADAQLTIDSALSINENTTFNGNAIVSSFNPDSFILGVQHENAYTFSVDSSTGDTTVTGSLNVSTIAEASNGAGINLQDNTSVYSDLTILNPTGALVNGTTVYIYVKYGADSLANGEYFHVFKTSDNGNIRQVIPLTLLQDAGLNKLAVKPSGIYEYQAVAGAYSNVDNVPNASFVVDTEGGTYTYQLRAYTSNDDGVEFEMAFSLDNANPAPTYNILYTANDASAYNTEYLISYDDALQNAVNFGAISTFNQVSPVVSVNSSTGDVDVAGAVSSYDLDVKNSNGASFLNVASNNVNINIYGANGNTDGFYINGGVNGNENFFMAQPNDLGGDGILYINGLLKVWNNGVINDNTFNVDNQANVTILGGDFSIQDTNLVDKLKLNNASGILEAVEISSFIGGTLTLSGNVVATTQDPNDNSTKLATTAYVDLAVAGAGETRYTTTDSDFLNDEWTIDAPLVSVSKDAYFIENGGVAGDVYLFALTNNDYDGYVLALFNTDLTASMTIFGDGIQTIGGSNSKSILPGGCLTIMARGTSWYIM
jgi:hypothetical protein